MAGAVRLLGVGGAHTDRRGRTFERFVAGASNPGRMREDIGGGAFNALRAATQRGVAASILSVRGGDEGGSRVARAVEAAGIEDISAVFLDRTTPSYTAILDSEGEVMAALADMDLYEIGFVRQIARRKAREAIAAADAILCDANLPTSALARLAGLASGKPIFALAVSPAKAVRLRSILSSLSVLFMNRREAAAIIGVSIEGDATLVHALRAAGVARAVISDGPRPLLAFEGEDVFAIAPPRPERVADATGAGDALGGTAVASLSQGAAFREAVRQGVAAAYLTLMAGESTTKLARAEFDKALALVPPAQGIEIKDAPT
jgi:pseudouridine kinase